MYLKILLSKLFLSFLDSLFDVFWIYFVFCAFNIVLTRRQRHAIMPRANLFVASVTYALPAYLSSFCYLIVCDGPKLITNSLPLEFRPVFVMTTNLYKVTDNLSTNVGVLLGLKVIILCDCEKQNINTNLFQTFYQNSLCIATTLVFL